MSNTAIEPGDFRNVLGKYPTGVTLVSSKDDQGPFAMVIGSFGSVSLDPPLVQFMPAKESGTWSRIKKTGKYCVNVLLKKTIPCQKMSLIHLWSYIQTNG